MADTEYATTQELNDFLGLTVSVPDLSVVGGDRSLETVGTGDGSTTIFFTSHAFVISGSYAFYYGGSCDEALSQPLTEGTHYSFLVDNGQLTLTASGVSLVGTDSIFGSYSYNSQGLTDSRLQDALNRSASQIDKECNQRWVDGSVSTPVFTQVLDEIHTGRGGLDRYYFCFNRPLPQVDCVVTSTVPVGSSSIIVDSTDGFPSSGYLGTGVLKIVYTGKTSTSFTGVSGVDSEIAVDSVLSPIVVEASNTPDGAAPVWTILEKDSRYDVDLANGRFWLPPTTILSTDDSIILDSVPQRGVPNRFRVSYLSGNDSIPEDITKLCLMVAGSSIIKQTVRNATIGGLDDFRPNLVNVDKDEIDELFSNYRLLLINDVN